MNKTDESSKSESLRREASGERDSFDAFPTIAFLIAQLGAHASAKFAERLTTLKLAPAEAGILRILASTPGITQKVLADRLQVPPSALVALLDKLQSRGLTKRLGNRDDRRRYALHLTEKGSSQLEEIDLLSRAHQDALLVSLSKGERLHLEKLLLKILEEQGLAQGIHPGYRFMKPKLDVQEVHE